MIRVKYKKDAIGWVSEQYLEEIKKIRDARKGRWLKKLKALIMGKLKNHLIPQNDSLVHWISGGIFTLRM